MALNITGQLSLTTGKVTAVHINYYQAYLPFREERWYEEKNSEQDGRLLGGEADFSSRDLWRFV